MKNGEKEEYKRKLISHAIYQPKLRVLLRNDNIKRICLNFAEFSLASFPAAEFTSC